MQAKKSSVTGIALVVAMGGFLMGFDASVISGVIKFIEPEFQLSKIELGWVFQIHERKLRKISEALIVIF